MKELREDGGDKRLGDVGERRAGEEGVGALPHVPRAVTCLQRSQGLQPPLLFVRMRQHFFRKASTNIVFQDYFHRTQASLLVEQ